MFLVVLNTFQETKARISRARQSLKTELEKQGVPVSGKRLYVGYPPWQMAYFCSRPVRLTWTWTWTRRDDPR